MGHEFHLGEAVWPYEDESGLAIWVGFTPIQPPWGL